MTELTIEFLRAAPEDAERILRLWKAADAVPSVTDTREDIQRMVVREHAAFILAMHQDQLVGSIIATYDGWRGNVYRLAVHPDYRRRGLARKLVKQAERVLSEWGVKRISAIVVKAHP